MAENWLESYLVSLGFSVDEQSFAKLKGTMGAAESTVGSSTMSMARKISDAESKIAADTYTMGKRVVEVQGAIGTAFGSVSAAILGVVDNVAMADQQYRLMGMSMLMTTEQARKMSLITKTLGADIGQIYWDRTGELQQRAGMFGADIDRMTAGLGTGFEPAMQSVRGFRDELGRLELAGKFLGMSFAADVWERIAPGADAQSLHDWITDLENRIPAFADKLSIYAIPALKGTWLMAQELGEMLKVTGVAFSNIIGLLSGDHSIEGTSFSFDNLAKSIEHVGGLFLKLFEWVANAEQVLAHFASGSALLLSGKFGAAADEYAASMAKLTRGSGSVLGTIAGAGIGPTVGGLVGGALGAPGGPLGIAAGGALGATAGGFIGPLVGAGIGASAGAGSEAGQHWASQIDSGEARKALIRELGGGAGNLLADSLAALRAPADHAMLHGLDLTSTTDAVEAIHRWKMEGLGSKKMPILPDGLHPGSSRTLLQEMIERLPEWPSSPESGVPLGSMDSVLPRLPNPTTAAATSGQSLTRSDFLDAIQVSNASLIDQLAVAITKYEHAKPELNNPGNLRSWGSFPTEGGFAKFPDFTTGWNALESQIRKLVDRGLTLEEFFAGKLHVYPGYAPAANHNQPDKYTDWVSKQVGIDPNTPLNQIITLHNEQAAGVIGPVVVSPQVPFLMPPPAPLPPGGPLSLMPPPPQALPGGPLSFEMPNLQPLWMAPPKDDGAPGDGQRSMSLAPPSWPAPPERDWTGLQAALNPPISLPQPNVISHSPQQTFTVDVDIHITQPGADAYQIERTVTKAIREAMESQIIHDLTRLSPQYG